MNEKRELAQLIQIPGIDMQSVMAYLDDDLNLFEELVQIYYKETSRLIIDLQNLLNEDINLFRSRMHNIKGSTASIGGKELANRAARLEEAAKNKEVVSIKNQLPIFLKDINKFLEDIEIYINDYIEDKELKDKVVVDCINKEDLNGLKKGFEHLDIGCIESYIEKLKRYEYAFPLQAFIDEIQECADELEYKKGSKLITEYLET